MNIKLIYKQDFFLFLFFFLNMVRIITPGWIKTISRAAVDIFSNDIIKVILMFLFEKSLLGRHCFVSSTPVKLNSYLSIIACVQKLFAVTLHFAIVSPLNSKGSALIVPGETI